MTVYRIELKNCGFFARHGVYSEEEVLGQRFYVDAILTVDGGASLLEDKLEGTVDYGTVYLRIEKMMLGKRFFLIEALAYAIAKSLCEGFPTVVSAEVTIRKPNAPVQGVLEYVAATVIYPQKS